MIGSPQLHEWTTSALVEHRDALFDPSIERWVVGLSGGLDSSALLYWLAGLPDRPPIMGLYIDHQLQSSSADWTKATRAQCDALKVSHRVIQVDVSGEGSLEAAARAARYHAFADVLLPSDLLLLGHHEDDQIETLLLNLLRGGDQFGLYGMPSQRPVGTARLLRPFLGVPKHHLEAYARDRGIHWVEDPSNQDQSHDRNYLRHTVLPSLDERFDNWRARALRGARKDHLAREAMTDLAVRDLSGLSSGGSLSASALSELAEDRRVRVVRALIDQSNATQPSRQALRTLLKQVDHDAMNARATLQLGSWSLRLERGRITLVDDRAQPFWQPSPWQPGERFRRRGKLILVKHRSRHGLHLPPDQFCLAPLGQGQKILRQHRIDIRERLRALGVPGWLRDRLPVLTDKDQVILVPAVTPWLDTPLIADDYTVGAEETGWTLSLVHETAPN